MRKQNLIVFFRLQVLFTMLFVFHVIKGMDIGVTSMNILQNQLIWTQEQLKDSNQQQYVVFRKDFELDNELLAPNIELFADSRYLLWINGVYVARGPVRFHPKSPEYDVIPVKHFLQKGHNYITVLVHSYGKVINGRIMSHKPGFALSLLDGDELIMKTDETWKYQNQTRYLPAPESWNSIPDRIDARIDNEEWLLSELNFSIWKNAKAIQGDDWGQFRKSEVPLRKEEKLSNVKILPQKENISFPILLKKGKELLVDLGTMAMVYTEMDLEADEGIALTIQYALRYQDGMPREVFGDGNSYITRQGKQHFITTDQWCSRYVSLKVDTGEILINNLSFINRLFPFERKGSFECSDSLLNELWKMGVKTIEVTSDDAYGSDARERNEWIQDAYRASFLTSSIALTSPDSKEKTDIHLLKNMLRHAALSQHEDGMLSATFPTDRGPSDCHYVIEDYACQWIDALHHYYYVTKDLEFVKEHKDVMAKLLDWYISRMTQRGLVYAREYASFDNPMAYVTCEGATLNAFVYHSLLKSVDLFMALGDEKLKRKYEEVARGLKKSYNSVLWNESEKAYGSAVLDGSLLFPSVHAQIFALYSNLVPEDRIDSTRQWLLKHYMNAGYNHVCENTEYKDLLNKRPGVGMPIIYHWLLKVLYDMDTEEIDKHILNNVRDRWFYMVSLQKDAGTLSESFVNSKGWGSHESCHNYGSTPVYYLSSYVLGVRDWDNKLIVEPRLGDLLYVRGKVVTSQGIISVDWQRLKGNQGLSFTVSFPDSVSGELRLPVDSYSMSIQVNNQLLVNKGIPLPEAKIIKKGRWIILKDIRGQCKGAIF